MGPAADVSGHRLFAAVNWELIRHPFRPPNTKTFKQANKQ